MTFEFGPAVIAGVTRGVALYTMSAGLKRVGAPLQIDIAMIWGTMAGLTGAPARALGFIIHLIVSAAVTLVYALGFDILGANDRLWLWGLGFGLVHWVLAGLFMAVLPAVHPRITEVEPAPGPFVLGYGVLDAVAFLASHLAYGLLVGVIYAYLHSGGGTALAF